MYRCSKEGAYEDEKVIKTKSEDRGVEKSEKYARGNSSRKYAREYFALSCQEEGIPG
jgi:hypothetical protein